ncbi:MAG: DUF177 domain-containing protein [Gammaproteobacteria bacterium]|nr:DUF177 domain-containing protein [Gammaproteobacteria bacterium]
MQIKLKQAYSVKKECSQKSTHTGVIDEGDLTRLSEAVNDVLGPVNLTFKIFKGYTNLPEIEGNYQVDVSLTCQRCLSDFKTEVKNDFHFYVGKNLDLEEEEFAEYETIFSNDEGLLDIVALVEDDIILNLPLIPKHETDCNTYLLDQQKQIEANPIKKKNPFEVLKGLKTSLKH